MKLLVGLFSVIALAQPLAVQKEQRNQAVKDFDFGGQVGSCLIAKCQVFEGVALTATPTSGQPVLVKVQYWLFGTPVSAGTIPVPYDERPRNRGLGGTTAAWANARFSGSSPVTVLMARETNAEIIANEPVLVTFDYREAGLVRELSEEASRLKSNPQLISAEIASLSAKSSPSLTGFLVHYVLFSKELPKSDLAAELLLQLLGHPAVPAERWESLPFFLIFYSGTLPPERQAVMLQRFCELAEQDDANASRAGFMGLAYFASRPEEPLVAKIPSSVRSRLAIAYRKLIDSQRFERSKALEDLLAKN